MLIHSLFSVYKNEMKAERRKKERVCGRSGVGNIKMKYELLLWNWLGFNKLTDFSQFVLIPAAYVNAGQVLTRLGRIADAREMYTTCLGISDEGIKDLRNHLEAKTSAYLRLGKLLVEDEDDPRAAIGVYRQAVQLMPSDYSQKQVRFWANKKRKKSLLYEFTNWLFIRSCQLSITQSSLKRP